MRLVYASLRWIVLPTALVGLIGTAAVAGDGVIEINQAKAIAGAVTSSDAPGFPVTLDAPGSYRLTGNLDVRAEPAPADVTAIEIVVSGVNLDLGGFAILGPANCSGSGASLVCTGAGGGVGVHTPHPFVQISNGTVRGMGAMGINLLGHSRVEDVTVFHSGGHGINCGFHSILVGNEISWNGGTGLHCLDTNRIEGNSIRGNFGSGIHIGGQDSIIRSNLSSENGEDGIYVHLGHSVIAGNIASRNAQDGIHVSWASDIFENTTHGNGVDGITVTAGAGSRIHGNTARENGDDGIQTNGASACSVTENVVEGNAYGLFLNSDTAWGGNTASGNATADILGGGVISACNVVAGARSCPP